MRDALPLLVNTDFPTLHRNSLETLQANLGYRCNQSCTHCHVAAGPQRTEEITWETMELLLHYLTVQQIAVLDLTGGAPELNPSFRRLVIAVRALGVHVIDRCNLTILGAANRLRQLNHVGYGQPDSNLLLNLVYNPIGPMLPPDQAELEAAYRQMLFSEYGIVRSYAVGDEGVKGRNESP